MWLEHKLQLQRIQKKNKKNVKKKIRAFNLSSNIYIFGNYNLIMYLISKYSEKHKMPESKTAGGNKIPVAVDNRGNWVRRLHPQTAAALTEAFRFIISTDFFFLL